MKSSLFRAIYRRFGAVLAGILFCCTALVPAFGQSDGGPQRPGLIFGKVKNASTNALLPTAYVRLIGTDLHTLTQSDGSFTLSAPPGTYTLEVYYTGLDMARVPVTVTTGQQVNCDVDLNTDLYKLGKFVVKGLAEGNDLALQEQRYADNPKTVIAINAYGQASGNPGELLQRVPGIDTNYTQGEITSIYVRGMNVGFAGLLVNGDPVAVSLGAITGTSGQYSISELATVNLSEIELIKEPTPDMDANNIAGSVNLISKRAFDANGREIALNLSTSMTDRGWSTSYINTNFKNLDRMALSYADVYNVLGGKKNLGVTFDVAEYALVRVSDEEGPHSVSSLSGSYTGYATATPLTNSFAIDDAGGTERKKTIGATAEYKLNNDSYIYANFGWTNMSRHIPALYFYALPNSSSNPAIFSPDSTYDNSTILPGNATASSRTLNSVRISTTFQESVGSEIKLFDQSVTLSLKGNYSHALSYNPWFVTAQSSDPGIGFNINRHTSDGAWYPKFTQTAGPSVNDPSSYQLNTVNNVATQGAPETVTGLRLDVKKDFSTAWPTYLKAGVKLSDDERNDRRFYDSETYVGPTGVPLDPTSSLNHFLGYSEQMSKAKYGPFPFAPLVTNKSQLAPNSYFAKSAAQAYSDLTNLDVYPTGIKQRYTEGYLEGHIEIGPLKLLGGMRVEETQDQSHVGTFNQSAANGTNSVGGASVDPVVVAANTARALKAFQGFQTFTNRYHNYFPGIHAIYEPIDGLIFRGSYNKTISRPDVGVLLQTVTIDSTNDVISVGNPNLKPYLSNNFEFSVEKYFNPAGVVSAGVFDKQISNYYRTFSGLPLAAPYAGNPEYATPVGGIPWTETTTLNIGSARIQGLEFSAQQQFTFLPGFLKGLGGFANFTYVNGKGTFGTLVNFGALAVSPRVAFLTPRTLNAGLSYVGYGLEARLMLNYQSDTYIGSSGIDYDAAGRSMVDMKLKYSFSKHYALEFNVTNLTNSYENRYIEAKPSVPGAPQLPFGQLNPGINFSVGVDLKF